MRSRRPRPGRVYHSRSGLQWQEKSKVPITAGADTRATPRANPTAIASWTSKDPWLIPWPYGDAGQPTAGTRCGFVEPLDVGRLYAKTDSLKGAPPHASIARRAVELVLAGRPVVRPRAGGGPAVSAKMVTEALLTAHSAAGKVGRVGLSLGACRRSAAVASGASFRSAIRVLQDGRLLEIDRSSLDRSRGPVVHLAPGGVRWDLVCDRVRAGHEKAADDEVPEPVKVAEPAVQVPEKTVIAETSSADEPGSVHPEKTVIAETSSADEPGSVHPEKTVIAETSSADETVIAETSSADEPGSVHPEKTVIAETSSADEPGSVHPEKTVIAETSSADEPGFRTSGAGQGCRASGPAGGPGSGAGQGCRGSRRGSRRVGGGS